MLRVPNKKNLERDSPEIKLYHFSFFLKGTALATLYWFVQSPEYVFKIIGPLRYDSKYTFSDKYDKSILTLNDFTV